jgi:hypothetical protein
MSEAKWNLGPWMADTERGTSYADDELHGRNCCIVECAEGYVVAMTLADIKELTPEANAHLIAAAPALYEAGHAVLMGSVSRAASDEDGERVNLNISMAAFKALEAALAKARGQQ